MKMKADNTFIEWKKSFEVGISIIDNQHKQILDLCNNLHYALMERRKITGTDFNEVFNASLHIIYNHAKYHFQTEEKLMISTQYSNYITHKAQHNDFSVKLLQTIKAFEDLQKNEKSTLALAMEFLKYIHDWFYHHIPFDDKLFAKTLLPAKTLLRT